MQRRAGRNDEIICRRQNASGGNFCAAIAQGRGVFGEKQKSGGSRRKNLQTIERETVDST